MRLLVTGNPDYGLAKAFASVFEATFVSRKTMGIDLSMDEGMAEFVNLSQDYNGVILNCYTEKMNNYSQARLLHKTYEAWVKREKTGKIVCIGSISDSRAGQFQESMKYLSYAHEKLALKTLCETICENNIVNSQGIECTYFGVGHMHTPYVDRLHPDETKLDTLYVANFVKWIIEQPEHIESVKLRKRNLPRNA